MTNSQNLQSETGAIKFIPKAPSVLLLSLFEGGYQPINALTGLAALRDAGHDVQFQDAYVSGFQLDKLMGYDYIIIPIPLFDSLKSAIQLIDQLTKAGSNAKIILYGQYASLNAAYLAETYADYVISGEWEGPLAALLEAVTNSPSKAQNLANIYAKGQLAPPLVTGSATMRGTIAKPLRSAAPPLCKYPQPQLTKLMGEAKRVGGIELTRGCTHKCTYCSVFAAYDGKVFLADNDKIIADIDELVEAGMTHLTFIDAEFFNAYRRSFDMLARIHQRHPSLTYDFTTRVDHILKHKDQLGLLYNQGVRVITSALEFPKNEVLQQIVKEVTVDDLASAVSLVQNSGITLNPTFIMYNPWVGVDDFPRFHEFIKQNNMEGLVDPVQFETRLHLYKGSPLLQNETVKALRLEAQEFHYEWYHSDPRVDELYKAALTPVPEGEFKRCCLKC